MDAACTNSKQLIKCICLLRVPLLGLLPDSRTNDNQRIKNRTEKKNITRNNFSAFIIVYNYTYDCIRKYTIYINGWPTNAVVYSLPAKAQFRPRHASTLSSHTCFAINEWRKRGWEQLLASSINCFCLFDLSPHSPSSLPQLAPILIMVIVLTITIPSLSLSASSSSPAPHIALKNSFFLF